MGLRAQGGEEGRYAVYDAEEVRVHDLCIYEKESVRIG